MKITQAYISECLAWFKNQWFQDYNLSEPSDPWEQVVMLGLYTDDDYAILKHYPGKVMVRWYGMDALMINEGRIKALQEREAVHVTHLRSISDILAKIGIEHELINCTESKDILRLQAIPRGDCIYHYSNGVDDFYGDNFLPEIQKRTGIEIIRVVAKTYLREEILNKIYPQCFIGLALTATGGTIGTIEQGLLGRRVLNNNGYPNCISWKNIDDICDTILFEYNHRHDDNTQISIDVKNGLDTDCKWLEI